jgi:hypothetical protein
MELDHRPTITVRQQSSKNNSNAQYNQNTTNK